VLSVIEILPLTPPADRLYGDIRASLERVGTPIGGNDLLIAAHALASDCILVTDNEREFSRVEGLVVENWLR
jgi:tRNA(fMet)-specific endonuclease VapC